MMERTLATLSLLMWTLTNLCMLDVRACSMKADDWKPMSLENRTIRAQVVIAGTVLRQRDRTPAPPGGSGEYAADVFVDEVYKGYPHFNKVAALHADPKTGAKIYRIGGFGPRERCLAQVMPNHKYIMFLSAVPVAGGREKGGVRLLARYDDIFGAVVPFDNRQEKRVHKVVGWREWAVWSSCPVTCGDGVQVRRRMCAQDLPDACEGAAEQTRHCNRFPCRDVKDLIQLMSLPSFPPGVRRAPPRRRAYHVSSNAILSLPLSAVYPGGFPEEFSILLVVKPPRYFSTQQNGYLYAMLVTGEDGGVQLGVQLSSSPALVYTRRDPATNKLRPTVVSFSEYPILKRRWNVLAFSIRRDSVTLHAECTKTFKVDLDKDDMIVIGPGSANISIGNPMPNMIDMYFEGDLEQLTLIDDPDAAALQCSSPMGMRPSNSAWPSINITDDLQGDMDSLLQLPTFGTKPKPKMPKTDPPTTHAATAKPTAPVSTPATDHDNGPHVGAPGIIAIAASAPNKPASSQVPFYNENNFDFVEDDFDNRLPNSDSVPSRPIQNKPPDIKFGGGNQILLVPGVQLDDIPTTPGQSEVLFKPIVEGATTSPAPPPSRTVEPKIENDVIPKSGTSIAPSIDPSSEPSTAFPTPTTLPTTEPATTTVIMTTTQVPKATAESSTLKLRLASAHRPESLEAGHRAPNYESGSSEGTIEGISSEMDNWSSWSTCSRTCGTGTRYRFSRCRPGSRLRDCKTGRGIAAQTRTCRLDDCRVPSLKWSAWSMCSRTCGDGVEMRMAYCYDNKVPGCEDNQKIVVERRRCRRRHCFDVCRPSCKNGGTCRPDRTCACPSGYQGDRCEIELCNHPCQNGGQCIAKNYCLCLAGYAPPRCTPVCNPRCHNGGTCKAPSECACPAGFTGTRCETAACNRPCQHGGTCTGLNTCSCRPGYQGQHCEQASCPLACQNGGTCIRPGFCRCPRAYRGRTCQIAYCRVTCLNGGRCSGPDTCTCAAGFGGAFCQRRLSTVRRQDRPRPIVPSNYARTKPSRRRKHHCKLRSALVSYQRSYVKPIAKTIQVKCGHWQPTLCTKTIMEYEAAYRTFYRMAYRRQCSSQEE